jgi:hypothetical protein
MEPLAEPELRRWIAASWILLLGLLSSGVYWMFWLPTVGKGGIFLAMGATLMPLFWEKIGVVGKMSWIAMLFLLLAVEYRAIDEEHRKSELAQQAALKAIGDGFTGVLTDQRNGFADLIQKSEAAFAKTTEQASAQFDATMKKAQVGINEITGGDSFAVLIPLTDGGPEKTALPVTISVCSKCLYSIPNAIVVIRPISEPASSNRLIYHGSIDPGFRVAIDNATVSVDSKVETDYVVTVFARNKVTKEKLQIRFNPTPQIWQFKFQIVRTMTNPHFNAKTKMAEGLVMKVLADADWDVLSSTLINQSKSKVIP